MYALTFRLRDFFIFAQSAYPSPFASEDAPSSFFFFSSAYYFALFPLDAQPQAKRGKKSAIRIPRSRFIPTDIVEEERNNRARTDRDECGRWCQGGKNMRGRTGSKRVK